MSEPKPMLVAVEAHSLDGRRLRLPSELEGERNLLAVAFQRRHQSDVDSWLEQFAELERGNRDLFTYEVPTISRRWAPVRGFIDGGMAAAIADPKARARTLTVYTDVDRVRKGLCLPDTSQIAVVLCDRDGVVEWLVRGPSTAVAARQLGVAINR
ncbi:MAG: hypothetical protein NTV40_09975 [Solirubrobacterales bacterium]|nr:hypothetical protein [Solirubrobacterales bacterium]